MKYIEIFLGYKRQTEMAYGFSMYDKVIVRNDLGYQLDTPGKREPHLKHCIHQVGQWACLSGIILIYGWYRKALYTMGGTIPR